MQTKDKDIIARHLPNAVGAAVFAMQPQLFSGVQEIRLRADKPMILHQSGDYFYITAEGMPTLHSQKALHTTQDDIAECFALISKRSVYAFMEEIKGGFITIEGGHRVGISGRAVSDKGAITNITDISGISIRVASQRKGIAAAVIPSIADENGVHNTLILSPPGAGKTTLLRDIARVLASSKKVCIVDERGEIAGCVNGVPQLDVGLMVDVLSGCPKSEGIMLMLRSMSPEVIVMDEIATASDAEALAAAISCGVTIIATIHGSSMDDLRNKAAIASILPQFRRVVVLSKRDGAGTIEQIIRSKE